MKKLLAMILCILMIVSLVPAGAFAEGEAEEAAPAEEPVAEEVPAEVDTIEPDEPELGENDLPQVPLDEEPITLTIDSAEALTTALNNAESGTTIELGEDITVQSRIELSSASSKNITLDFKGKKLSYTGTSRGVFIVKASVNLALTDTSDSKNGGIEINSTKYGDLVNIASSKASVTILDGIYNGSNLTSLVYSTDSYGALTVSGGTITFSSEANTTFVSSKGTLKVQGGTFNVKPSKYVTEYFAVSASAPYTVSEAKAGVISENTTNYYLSFKDAKAAAVKLTTSTIILYDDVALTARNVINPSSGSTLTLNLNGKNVSFSGNGSTNIGAFSVNDGVKFIVTGNGTFTNTGDQGFFVYGKGENSEVVIENGTFTGLTSGILSGSGTLTVTGGTFDIVPTVGVGDAYKVVDNKDGTWTVAPDIQNPEAKVTVGETTTKYATFGEALAAANTASVAASIDLCKNVEVKYDDAAAGEITNANGVTLKLNGFTITNTGSARTFTVKCPLTIEDNTDETGAIIDKTSYTDKGSILYLTTGSNVTIKGGTFYEDSEKTGKAVSIVYAYKTNGLKIEGGVFKSAVDSASASVGKLNLSSGSYANDVNEYLKAGYIAKKDETTNLWDISVLTSTEEATATVYDGTTTAYYSYFDTALADALAKTEAKITLYKDCCKTTAASKVEAGHDLTLDLNGCILTNTYASTSSSADPRTFDIYGNLQIISTAENGMLLGSTKNASASGGVLYVRETGTLTIKSGLIKNRSEAANAIFVCLKDNNKGKLQIEGGAVIGGLSRNSGALISVSGGFFSDSVSSSYCANGYTSTRVSNGPEGTSYAVVLSENIKDFTVKYDANGGNNPPLDQTTKIPTGGYERILNSRVAVPYKKGCKFDSWNTSPEGDGDSYTSGAAITLSDNIVNAPDYTLTLYAQWVTTEDRVAKSFKDGESAEIKYATLAEALFEAPSGSTVELLCNVEENVSVPVNQIITLDLADYNITGAGIGSAITNKGTLKITGTGNVYGEAQSNGGGIENSGADSLLVIEGGNISGIGPASAGGIYNNGGTVTINGGTIGGTSNGNGGSINNKSGTVTIKSGTINGTAAKLGGAIYNEAGIVNIEGGTITGQITAEADASGGAIYNCAGCTVNITGGTVNGTSTIYGGCIDNRGTLNISGGTIDGTSASNGGAVYCNAGTVNISGGEIKGQSALTSETAGHSIYAKGSSDSHIFITGGKIKNTVSRGIDGDIQISGGFFAVNPTSFLATGASVRENDDETYKFAAYKYAIKEKNRLILSDSLDLIFSADVINAPDGAEIKMEFSMENYDGTREVEGVTSDGKFYTFNYDAVSPVCLANDVTATLMVNGTDCGSYTISALDYLEKVSTGEDAKKYEAVICDLIKYCIAAQDYKGKGETETFVPITAIPNWVGKGSAAEMPESVAYKYSRTDNSYSVGGVSVIFDVTNTIKVKFTAPEGAKLYVDGAEDGIDDFSVYYVKGIKASQYGDTHSFVIKDAEGNVKLTFEYSVNAYAASVYKYSNSVPMKALALAVYRYGLSAAALKA